MKSATVYRLVTLIGASIIVTAALLLSWMPVSLDGSTFKSNSLPESMIAVLETIPGEINVTAHIDNRPELRQRVLRALEPYRRARPDMTIKWQSLTEAGDALAKDGQLLLAGNGHTSLVHTLGRDVLNRGFYQLVRGKQRWIGFMQSGEPFPLEKQESGGFGLLKNRLQQQGFSLYSIDPEAPLLPDNIDVLIVRMSSAPFNSEQLTQLNQWLSTGKSMLWLQEGDADTETQLLLAQFGIQLLPGWLVDADNGPRETLGLRHPAVIASRSFGDHPLGHGFSGTLIFPLAHGLIHRPLTGWSATPLVLSSDASWNETSALSGKLNLDTDREKAGPHVVVLALENTVSGQRVAIVGDSDFLANDYLGLGANPQLAIRLPTWLAGDDLLINVDARQIPDETLTLSPGALIWLAIFWLAMVPVSLLLAGGWLWYRRRHARIT